MIPRYPWLWMLGVMFGLSIGCDDARVDKAVDADGDGTAPTDGDCDDHNAAVFPGAPDPVGDGLDSDCDALDGVDGDADGIASLPSGGEDCDDADPLIPGEETPDGREEDCSGCADDFRYAMSWSIASSDGTEFFGLMATEGVWLLGLAETGAGEGGWYGEDCKSAERCHEIQADDYHHIDVVTDPSDVVLGWTSLFGSERMAHATAYIERPSWACLVLGHDPDYYADRGCCPSPNPMWFDPDA